jgi:SpoVK/Ycf46/Vps4 family AAA+-type ATPase
MYAAVQSALRSASPARHPARFICHRRYPLPARIQPFHSTRRLAQSTNPPPTPDNNPVGQNDAEKKNNVREAAEQSGAGAASEDAEVLALKLQRSRETARRYSSALKRTQRRNRASDLPPIYIPEWFLDRRVILREDARLSQLSVQDGCTVSMKDADLGDEATCSIPFAISSAAISIVSQVAEAKWGKGLTDEQKTQLATDVAWSMGQKDDAVLIEALVKGNDLDGLVKDQTTADTDGVGGVVAESDSGSGEETRRNWLAKDTPGLSHEISPLLFAEIRAAAAASLAAIHPSSNNTFPSARSNIILHSPENGRDEVLSNVVLSVASQLGADVVRLTAQDIAQLAGDYLGEGPEPSPHSIRNLAYDTYKLFPDLVADVEELEKEDTSELYPDAFPVSFPFASESAPGLSGDSPGSRLPFAILIKTLNKINGKSDIRRNTGSLFSSVEGSTDSSTGQPARTQSQSEAQLEDLKLTTLLEALVESTELKRKQSPPSSNSDTATETSPAMAAQLKSALIPSFFNFSHADRKTEMDLNSIMPPITQRISLGLTVNSGPSTVQPQLPPRPRIIHVTDIKELQATQNGSRVMQKLEEIVRRLRGAGEGIMIMGTTSSRDLTPELSVDAVQELQSEGRTGYFRTIVVPPVLKEKAKNPHTTQKTKKPLLSDEALFVVERSKYFNINVRHIQDMLHSLDPASSIKIADFRQALKNVEPYKRVLPINSRAMTHDEIHRIAMTALGLCVLQPGSEQSKMNWGHLALAMCLLKASDKSKFAYMKSKARSEARSENDQLRAARDKLNGFQRDSRKGQSPPPDPVFQEKLRQVQATATPYERKLMHGIVNPQLLRTTFDQVHVPKETIEAIRTVTSMSLLRPDAFNYGVLAHEKVSGALLYGPPGTGKTLLAKAVAKESGSTMVEISGSQIMDKYVGEGEKNVEAIFSLARKMSPCIVFLDEADAIFGTRDTFRERTSHREILNQFLKEWDGLTDSQVFVMLATNRPFDLDDAVIRRLPRRLLVDLPTQEDRAKILQIHLKDEQMDGEVNVEDLAKRTPLYSGSDLKNVAVFAALACVREENEQAALAAAKAASESAQAESVDAETAEDASTSTSTPTPSTSSTTPTPSNAPILVQGIKYSFPDRRTLHNRHFDKAIQEVSASISENMSSLTAIKKFDEQYGDKRNKKKTAYGFGKKVGTNEGAARVRGVE